MDEIKISNNKEYRFSLDFVVFMEDGAYVAYCPSLDISTCANTYNEAISNFYEMFQLHIETCVECGTLHDDLIAHGWKWQKHGVKPPTFLSLMKLPEMKKLINSNASFERIVTPARIPAMA